MADEHLKWLEACEQDFRAHTGVQCSRQDDQGRPILDVFFPDKDLTFGTRSCTFDIN